MYRLRRKPSLAFATRIMGRRLATRAAITLSGTLAAISSLAFSLACSVSLRGLWRALQPSLRSAFGIASPRSSTMATCAAGLDHRAEKAAGEYLLCRPCPTVLEMA